MDDIGTISLNLGGNAEPTNSVGEFADFLSLDGNSGNGSAGGSGGDDGGFDPSIHVSPDKRNADGSYTKKRGRRSSGGNSSNSGSKRKTDHSASIDSLTRVLSILHIGIAGATKSPEMILEDTEAESLAKATANVLEQFDIKPDPKIEAIVGLVMVSATIYGPRVYNIRERRKEELQLERH